MEFVSNLSGGWSGRDASGPAVAPRANPEWSGLRARLSAAYCARRVLLGATAQTTARAGSFGRGAAAALAPEPPGSSVINPNDLGDGKPQAGKEDAVAVRNDRATRECCND
jgi:hypothetical protein